MAWQPRRWRHHINGIGDIETHPERDPETIGKCLNAIADILDKPKNAPWFKDFWDLDDFRVIDDQDEANDLLASFYDYCDERRIWIHPAGWGKKETG